MAINGQADRVPAPERVYLELRRAILEGEVGPGHPLTTLAVAERLGVSRTPVRSALVRLEAEGLVESAGGQSARVRGITSDEVEHAYDVAMGLEGMLVFRLAEAAGAEQVGALSAAVDGMEHAAAEDDKAAWVAADARFHALLVEFGQNALVDVVMDRVETVIGRLRFVTLHVIPHGAVDSAAEHRAVVEAIRARQAEQARHVHHQHWERVRAANIEFLSTSFSGKSGYLMSAPRRSPSPRTEGRPA
ncbi:MAG: GntR family transcriptional regulator [Actinomycetales bacterium]|nr:GntR family transcriptional regulator [Actinomycetales bacterium]